MQITITGPRGGGATTLAVEISKLIEGLGGYVHFVSRRDSNVRLLRSLMKCPTPLEPWRSFEVTIVDGVEFEDEKGVCDSSVAARINHQPLDTREGQ